MSKKAFRRVVRGIEHHDVVCATKKNKHRWAEMGKYPPKPLMWSKKAMEVLEVSAQLHIVGAFQKANLLSNISSRTTLMGRDLRLVEPLFGRK